MCHMSIGGYNCIERVRSYLRMCVCVVRWPETICVCARVCVLIDADARV